MPAPTLREVRIRGVPGLPDDLVVAFGDVTAVVGPRASGKSQLLSSIAWLLTADPPIATFAGGDAEPMVAAIFELDGQRVAWERRPRERPEVAFDPPTSSFLRARDRIIPSRTPTGVVAGRVAASAQLMTSDAAAAQELVAAVRECCIEGVAGEVVLIEEPELFLTPQAQRYLYRLLRQFADLGNQVIYSTRSPAFVDAARHSEIVRLDLANGRRSMRRTPPRLLTERQKLRLAADFDHERSEMFFARAVVLVEGQTERLSLPFVFRAMGHDPDAEGISIVEVGGKSNLPPAARVLRELGIPFVTVFDADRGSASAALDAEIREAVGGEPVIRLGPDFEAVAGLRARDDKVFRAWRRFRTLPDGQVPDALASIVTTLMDHVGLPSRGT